MNLIFADLTQGTSNIHKVQQMVKNIHFFLAKFRTQVCRREGGWGKIFFQTLKGGGVYMF